MGAGFSTVFHGCPLRVNCTASWTHPESRDSHLLIGAEEGLYTLNLTQLHDAIMDRVSSVFSTSDHQSSLSALSRSTPAASPGSSC